MTERAVGRTVGGPARRAAVVVALAAAAVAGACDDAQESPRLVGSGRDGPSIGATPGAELPDVPLPSAGEGPRQVGMVQIAAFPDSAAALRLRDSLVSAGWRANVRAVPGDTLPPWRVRVLPTADRELLQLAAAAWRAAGRPVLLVGDTASPRAPEARLHLVNRGARGAAGAVRWALSPDRRAILVVEDVEGAGGAPHPDAFLHAAEERGVVLQRDSVWDVAPDPAWRRVAFGRAFLVRSEGRDAVSATPWLAIAARTNMNPSMIRRGAFDVGADGMLQGFAQPVIEPLADDSTARSLRRAVSDPVPMAGGWRLRWSADAAVLAVGLAPARVARDDAPPARWVAVDASSRLVKGDVTSYVRLTTTPWTTGPTFGPGTRAAGAARLPIAGGGEVRSANGWITVRGAGGGAERVIGPGTALAATAGGRFVAALVPAAEAPAGAAESTPGVRVVVYELTR